MDNLRWGATEEELQEFVAEKERDAERGSEDWSDGALVLLQSLMEEVLRHLLMSEREPS